MIKLKKEITFAEIVSNIISFTALALSIYLSIRLSSKEDKEEVEKYKIDIQDVYTNKTALFKIQDFMTEPEAYNMIFKKILVLNEGTRPMTLLRIYNQASTDNFPFYNNQDTISMFYFLLTTNPEQTINTTMSKVYNWEYFRSFPSSNTNIKLEPGEGKEIYLCFLNQKSIMRELTLKNITKTGNSSQYLTNVTFVFSNNIKSEKKMYFDKAFMENFGGGGGSF